MHFEVILKYLLKHCNCFSRRVIHITMYIKQLETEVHGSPTYSAVTIDFSYGQFLWQLSAFILLVLLSRI